jgi:hypothetical protein
MVTYEAQKHSGSPLLTTCVYVCHMLTQTYEVTLLYIRTSLQLLVVTCFTDGCPCGHPYPWNVASTDVITAIQSNHGSDVTAQFLKPKMRLLLHFKVSFRQPCTVVNLR